MAHAIHRIAYAVTDLNAANGERRSRWHRVGVTFLNKDGSETVLLAAAPLSGKLVLQPPKTDSGEPREEFAPPPSDVDGLDLE